MLEMAAKLIEVTSIGGEMAGILEMPESSCPEPGQYLPCQRIEAKVSVPVNLFRVYTQQEGICFGPIPADWQPGDDIAIGPVKGKGFSLPKSARRIGLLAMGVSPSRILSLVHKGLEQHSAITLFTDYENSGSYYRQIPSDVEISPMASLGQDLDWPDFLAVDTEHDKVGDLYDLLRYTHPKTALPFDGEILLRVEMPCHGLGSCGVCAVETSRGWRMACVDGPVFPLVEILNVAR